MIPLDWQDDRLSIACRVRLLLQDAAEPGDEVDAALITEMLGHDPDDTSCRGRVSAALTRMRRAGLVELVSADLYHANGVFQYKVLDALFEAPATARRAPRPHTRNRRCGYTVEPDADVVQFVRRAGR